MQRCRKRGPATQRLALLISPHPSQPKPPQFNHSKQNGFAKVFTILREHEEIHKIHLLGVLPHLTSSSLNQILFDSLLPLPASTLIDNLSTKPSIQPYQRDSILKGCGIQFQYFHQKPAATSSLPSRYLYWRLQ